MANDPAPALKDWFDTARFHNIAGLLSGLHPGFDEKRFLSLSLDGLEELSLLQRLRRMTVSIHEALPLNYLESLVVLRELAPLIDHSFVTLVLPDFVGQYGHENGEESLAALAFFTRFGSSEFAIREYLKRDLHGTLRTMHEWSLDPDEHVRRLASEGCRPRLPWSFQLTELIADPTPALTILENLKADPALYVRKSVANHLNDISRDHPDIVLNTLRRWDRDHPSTKWITKQALRTLIKQGHVEALTLLGAGEPARVQIDRFDASPEKITPGGKVCLSLELTSLSRKPQRLLIDYAVHYVKKTGTSSAKVFKWTERDSVPGESLLLKKHQTFKDFTTRKHYSGIHRIELLINGESRAETEFLLEK
jgi:3-methyladenine DNA glycosylase AlkC